MSATATSIPRTEQKLKTDLDPEWLRAALTRWKCAAEFVFFLDQELLPTEHPLREVVGQDFPELVRELIRLKPNLRAQ